MVQKETTAVPELQKEDFQHPPKEDNIKQAPNNRRKLRPLLQAAPKS